MKTQGSMDDPYYKSRYTPNPDRAVVWREIVRFLEPYLSNAKAVLDLGAGYCDFINLVRSPVRIAVDISPELTRFAEPGVRTIRAFTSELSEVADASLDIVFSSNVLEHLTDVQLVGTMEEIKRVLKPGGMFITMQPNFRYAYKVYFDDPTHKQVFSHVGLEAFLVSHDFDIVKKMPKYLPVSMDSRPGLIPISGLLVRLYLHSPWKPFAGQMLFIARKQQKPAQPGKSSS